MSRKTPVIIAGTNCLSGVTSWADQLRTAFADHPRYEIKTLYIGPEENASADIAARTLEEAHQTICQMAPAILIPNYVWPLFFAGFEPGIRCIGMCHADDVTQYYRPLSWYEPAIAKYIAVSSECRQRLAEHVPCRTEDIAMLPYGVRIPTSLDRTYQTKPLRLIYAGRVTQPQKRVWDFVPLAEHLLRAKVPFVFDIYGDGDEFEPLQRMMRARVPAADVHFHGRVSHSEMAEKWLNHDIFLQVSDFEGTSVSMLEAMAHGVVPVVTAASSGIAGVINHQDNGFVVSVGDMAAMANLIAQLANNPALAPNVGRAAYCTAQPYAMDLYATRFARIIDAVADADQGIDFQGRYGRYTPMHPLLVQQQLVAKQQSEIAELKERLSKRLFKGAINRWRRTKSQSEPRHDQRAA